MKNSLILTIIFCVTLQSCKTNTGVSSAKESQTVPSPRDKKLLEIVESRRAKFRRIDKIYDRYHWSYKGNDLTAQEKEKRQELWYDASKKRDLAYQEYIPVLLEYWAGLTNDQENLQAQDELQRAIADIGYNKGTESEINLKRTIAEFSWPLLASAAIQKSKADYLCDLIEIPAGVRANDRMHLLGFPTEPYGWDLQIIYSLALIRAENYDQALKEISIVESKIKKSRDRAQKVITSEIFKQKDITIQNVIKERYSLRVNQFARCELLRVIVAYNKDLRDKAEELYNNVLFYKQQLESATEKLLKSPEITLLRKSRTFPKIQDRK